MVHPIPVQRLATIAALFFLADARARAVDASDVLVYSIGSVRVRPHAAVSETYNDNIFYRSSQTNAASPFPVVGDFITTVSPGVSLELGRREANHVKLDYTLDKSWYLDDSDQGHLDHIVSLGMMFQGNRLSLTGDDRFQSLSGILGGGQNLGQRVDRLSFFDVYRVDYRLGEKTGLYVVGDHSATDYKSGTQLYDEQSVRGTGGFSFKLTEKTGLFGELYYGQSRTAPNVNSVAFPNQDHLNYFGGFLGARGQFTTRLSGSVKVGYESRFFSHSTTSTETPVVEASLDQQFSERTSASVSYARRSAVSVQSSLLASPSYTTDTFGLTVHQVITSDGKLVATVGGNFENDGYDSLGGVTRVDQVYRASFGLTYNLQLWLSAKLAYQFEKYASNSNLIIDYTVNSVTLSVSVGY
jgi:hypothetical protein